MDEISQDTSRPLELEGIRSLKYSKYPWSQYLKIGRELGRKSKSIKVEIKRQWIHEVSCSGFQAEQQRTVLMNKSRSYR